MLHTLYPYSPVFLKYAEEAAKRDSANREFLRKLFATIGGAEVGSALSSPLSIGAMALTDSPTIGLLPIGVGAGLGGYLGYRSVAGKTPEQYRNSFLPRLLTILGAAKSGALLGGAAGFGLGLLPKLFTSDPDFDVPIVSPFVGGALGLLGGAYLGAKL